MSRLNALERQAQKPTGSIPPFSCFALYGLARYFQPTNILEIGTYIGKSTLSMAHGVDRRGVEIHTCDISNDLTLPNNTECTIVQYNEASNSMLDKIIEDDSIRFDMVNLDGRITQEDIDKLSGILTEDSVICLDDFEGIEKGVANYSLMRSSNLFNNYTLIYPPQESLIASMQFTGNSTIAVMIPVHLISFVSQ
jgi:predicted O-methyltransferase YrrM